MTNHESSSAEQAVLDAWDRFRGEIRATAKRIFFDQASRADARAPLSDLSRVTAVSRVKGEAARLGGDLIELVEFVPVDEVLRGWDPEEDDRIKDISISFGETMQAFWPGDESFAGGDSPRWLYLPNSDDMPGRSSDLPLGPQYRAYRTAVDTYEAVKTSVREETSIEAIRAVWEAAERDEAASASQYFLDVSNEEGRHSRGKGRGEPRR